MSTSRIESRTFSSRRPKIQDHTIFEIVKENEHIWDECMQKLEDSEKDETRKDIAEAFRVFDRNQDGYLCKKDITMMMHNIGEDRMSEKDIKEFMACGDRDGDGLIDFKDFLKMMLESPLSPLASQTSTSISTEKETGGS